MWCWAFGLRHYCLQASPYNEEMDKKLWKEIEFIVRLFFRSFVLTIVARCSSNRYWQDWTQALMKDLTANIDVILLNYGHFFLFDILVNCTRCWRWGVISKDWEELAGQQLQWIITLSGTIFYETKIRAWVYRGEPLWFWLSLLLDLGVLWLLSAFATDVEVLIDALPQDDLGRCLWDLLVWHMVQLGPFFC